jgi:glycosyltransferase involved in cell wall biosynthesis
MYPKADVYTLFYDKRFTKKFLPDREVKATFLQKIPGISKIYKIFLPLMPTAAESLDLSAYDLVISSSVAFAKGLVLRPKTTHVSYCHSPTRFLWDRHVDYVKEKNHGLIVKFVQHWLRVWDNQAAQRVDYFLANSRHTLMRIYKYYNRTSKVIYPPVETGELKILNGSKDFYLIVSQLLPHKNIDVAVDTLNKLGLPLIIAGDGPMREKLQQMAKKNIRMVGYVNNDQKSRLYEDCKAFIMPQEEDFGIAPVEAMLRGKPVLALKRGGALEYVLENINGEFFDDPVPEVLADGVRRLNDNHPDYSPKVIRKSAERFSRERFEREFKGYIDQCLKDNQK